MFLDSIPIRFRLALGHALGMALLFLAIGFGIFRLVENYLTDSFDAALMTSAHSIRDARFIKGFSSPLMQSFLESLVDERSIRPFAQLVDLSGRVSAKTSNVRVNLPVTPGAVARAESGLPTVETFSVKNQSPLRQVTLPVMVGGRFTGELVQVGASLEPLHHTLTGISLMLWSAMPLGLLLTIVVGYFLTKRSLRPVSQISAAAARLGANDLALRLQPPRAKDELRELTQTFNGMLDRLDDAFTRLRHFAGDVSHELRTPLAVLRGEAELTLRRERSPDEYRTALKTIEREAMHMSGIVEDLLLLARVQSKAVEMRWETVDVEDFCGRLEAAVGTNLAAKNVTLEINHHNVKTLHASPSYLNVAVKNLLLNAIKHSPAGLKVGLEVTESDSQVFLKVKDQGEGIPAEALPYIFDAFYRVDSARNRSLGGCGIGLSLAQAMVRLHSGEISVKSKVGEGSEFAIAIPRRVESDAPVRKAGKPITVLKPATA